MGKKKSKKEKKSPDKDIQEVQTEKIETDDEGLSIEGLTEAATKLAPLLLKHQEGVRQEERKTLQFQVEANQKALESRLGFYKHIFNWQLGLLAGIFAVLSGFAFILLLKDKVIEAILIFSHITALLCGLGAGVGIAKKSSK